MMRNQILTLSLALGLFATAPTLAQDAVVYEAVAETCLGLYIPIVWEAGTLSVLPVKSCEKVCKATLKQCAALVKSDNQCGKIQFKARAKIACELTKGLDLPKEECKRIQSDAKANTTLWLDDGEGEKRDCVVQMIACMVDNCF